MADLTAVGQVGSTATLKPKESMTFALTGTFTGEVGLYYSGAATGPWKQVTSLSSETSVTVTNESNQQQFYRTLCLSIGEAETITDALTMNATDVVISLVTEDGKGFVVTESGGTVVGTFGVSGTATLSGATTLSGTNTLSGATTVTGGLNVTGNGASFGVDDTGVNVTCYGATSGKYMQWAQSADKLTVNGDFEVTGSAEFPALKNAAGQVVYGWGADVPADAATGYAKGCLFIQTDGTDQTNTLYCNIGDHASANFNAVTIAAD